MTDILVSDLVCVSIPISVDNIWPQNEAPHNDMPTGYGVESWKLIKTNTSGIN